VALAVIRPVAAALRHHDALAAKGHLRVHAARRRVAQFFSKAKGAAEPGERGPHGPDRPRTPVAGSAAFSAAQPDKPITTPGCATRFRDQASPATPPGPRPAWASAVTALLDLQEEYRDWLDRVPETLEGSRTAEKLRAIGEIDLDEQAAIDPPRGYGRD
jgi:hypothetical protein